MKETLEQDTTLYQADTLVKMQTLFGMNFIVENDNGSISIDRRVLAAFRKLTAKTAVWDRGGKFWRMREATDAPSRLAS